MRNLKLFLAASLFFIGHSVFAAMVVPPFYAGVFGEVSHVPSINFTIPDPFTTAAVTGDLKYGVGGGVGADMGMRYNQFRIEGEFLYNYNELKKLALGRFVIKSRSSSAGLRLRGYTGFAALLANAFYDFYLPNPVNETVLSPYVGVGIGYARVINSLRFYFDNVLIGGTITDNSNHPVVQGIIGFAYYLDDYTSLGLDYRYLTTVSKVPATGNKHSMSSINLLVNFYWDCFTGFGGGCS